MYKKFYGKVKALWVVLNVKIGMFLSLLIINTNLTYPSKKITAQFEPWFFVVWLTLFDRFDGAAITVSLATDIDRKHTIVPFGVPLIGAGRVGII